MPLFKKLALCKSCHLFRCLNWLPRQSFPACTSLNIPFCPVTKSLSSFLVPNREDWSWMWQSVVNVNPDHTINPWITGWGEGGKEDDYTLPELSAAAAQRFASGTPSPMTASFVLAPIILIIPQSGLMATDSSSFDPLVYPLLGYDLPFSGWKQPLSLEPIYPVLLKWFLFWVVRKKCNFLSYVMCFFFLPQNPLKSQCWLHQGWLFLVICFWLSKLTGIVLD